MQFVLIDSNASSSLPQEKKINKKNYAGSKTLPASI
jgi:hypothetical protein